MKNVVRMIAISAMASLFYLSAFAKLPEASLMASPAAPAQDQQQVDLYNRWRENRTGDAAKQKIAYEAGKEYLSKYGSRQDEYVKAVQKWVTKYEQVVAEFNRDQKFRQSFEAARRGDYRPLFTAGEEVLAADPDNFFVVLTLANAGYLNATAKAPAAPDKILFTDTVAYTKRLIEMIEAGSGSPADFKTIGAANKDDALGWLNYRLGLYMVGTSPEEAANYFLKAAQSNSAVKSEPTVYHNLAEAYANGEFTKLAAAYDAKYADKAPTPEGAATMAKMNQVVDRILDAYARAVVLYTKPEHKAAKDAAMASLTGLYKLRHKGKEDGLDEFIAVSPTRRLPLPSDPLPTP